MKITQPIHQRIRVKNGLITLLILFTLITLAWFSRLYSSEIDVTANASNTLTASSQKILATLPEPITITAYIKEKTLQQQLALLLNKYLRFKKDISYKFINPDTVPDTVRELNIGPQGAIIVEYKGSTEKLLYLDESSLTNALLQLANTSERWVTFITGHGERSPIGNANFDLGLFGKALERHKIKVQTLNLTEFSSIPDNSSLLVLASPSVDLLAGEIDIISNYTQKGGNLLILTDPDNYHLTAIEQQIAISRLPGTVVDSSTDLYGVNDPSFIIVSQYTRHPITVNLNSMTIFPKSTAFEIDDESEFTSESILSSTQSSWTETGDITGTIHFNVDSDEKQGPLTIAYALTRDFSDKNQQRIVIVGDADFLSNAYLGNVGNSELGFRLINWLTDNDNFIEIPAKIISGKSLQLGQISVAIIGFGFLIGLPLLLIMTGFFIWRKRKQR